MPSYAMCRITMKGLGDLDVFVDGALDFEKIKPMPRDLDDSLIRTDAYEAMLYYYTERLSKPDAVLTDAAKEALATTREGRIQSSTAILGDIAYLRRWTAGASDKERTELYDAGRRCARNIEKYGAPTWYEWRIKNWGTKWNAVDGELETPSTATFQTAWRPPLPIAEALSKMRPDAELELIAYTDDDVYAAYHRDADGEPGYEHKFTFKNGECVGYEKQRLALTDAEPGAEIEAQEEPKEKTKSQKNKRRSSR